MTDPAVLLELTNVTKRFDSPDGGATRTVLDDVSLRVEAGRSLAIWVAGLKIVRLLIGHAYYGFVCVPIIAKSMMTMMDQVGAQSGQQSQVQMGTMFAGMYWAQAVAAQSDDAELATRFSALASTLAENEAKIVSELAAVQGRPVEALDNSYYHTDLAAISEIMRPSETLNATLENFSD